MPAVVRALDMLDLKLLGELTPGCSSGVGGRDSPVRHRCTPRGRVSTRHGTQFWTASSGGLRQRS